MSSPNPPRADKKDSLSKQHGWKWLCAGLGCLLIGWVLQSHPLGREAFVHLLGFFGPRAVPWLLPALLDNDQGVRLEAHVKIARMGSAAVPALLVQLKKKQPATRVAAALMLGAHDVHTGEEKRICGALLNTLSDEDESVRLAGIQAQSGLGPGANSALPKLITMLGELNPEIRLNVLKAVVNIDRESKATLTIVLRMLRDPDPTVRTTACSCLEHIGTRDPLAVVALIAVLHDPAPNVRLAAIDYLGEIGSVGKVAIPALQDVADHDSNPQVRALANQAIKDLNQPPAP